VITKELKNMLQELVGKKSVSRKEYIEVLKLADECSEQDNYCKGCPDMSFCREMYFKVCDKTP